MQFYISNIEKNTKENDAFRRVVATGQHAQVVLMAIPPGGEIGQEVHEITDQFFRVEGGEGTVIVDGQEHAISDGSAFLVEAGMQHNVINTSPNTTLRLYTIYAPPHHTKGVVHATKAEANADTDDHIG
ncbi:MAG: cupin domain-containing protein [Pseudomonadales bacterium]|nr:cupin domain-containing protein [Candidatus Woesebacteria bacterium]MCB9801627.1 cupin domain-containing protein [Pseudomonadales bacterium]